MVNPLYRIFTRHSKNLYFFIVALILLTFTGCPFSNDESSEKLEKSLNRDAVDSGSSIVPQKREQKVESEPTFQPVEEIKSKDEIGDGQEQVEVEELEIEESEDVIEEDIQTDIIGPIEHKEPLELFGSVPDHFIPMEQYEPVSPPEQVEQDFGPPDANQQIERNLDALFEKTKQTGSLHETLKQHAGTHFDTRKSDEMGPPPLPDQKVPGHLSSDILTGPPIPEHLKDPQNLPEINIQGMDDWDFMGPPLPEPDQVNLLEDSEEEEMEEVEEIIIHKFDIEFMDTDPPEDRKFVDLSADKITRDKLNHTVFLEGNSKVVYEDVIILSEFCEFNDDEEWGKFWGSTGVLSESDDGISKCERMEAFFKDKNAYLHENVEIFVFGKDYEDELEEDAPKKERVKRALGQDDTTVYCDEVVYNWGEKTFYAWVETSEIVKLVQDGRYAHSLAMYHEKKTELTILEGKVELWQKNGDWLFNRDVVTDKEDKWANALLRPETTVTCNLLESYGEDEITILDGNVLAVQKGKTGSADKIVNDDKEKLLTADGNVKYHHDNGDWLIKWDIVDPQEESDDTKEDLAKSADAQADNFILWTDDENFEAEGNVKVWQEHQEASMDKAIYTKELDRLQVFGNVKFKREAKHDLLSDEGILWLTTKVYEAFGNVKSKSKVDLEEEIEESIEEENTEEESK